MIEKMRESGKKVAEILDSLHSFIVEGISTEDIDIYCGNYIKKMNCISGALGYRGFPKNVCVSLNNKVCHGISSSIETIKNGDIVSVDIALKYEDHYGDSCFTYVVGSTKPIYLKLVESCYESMWRAIEIVRPGLVINELGLVMQKTAESFGFQTVRDFCGHGIGKNMHEDPQIPFFYEMEADYVLQNGDFITIEPMVVERNYGLKILKDDWTAVTRDGGYAAQFEHVIAVTMDGYEVMTYNSYDISKNKKRSYK